jgi:hypothetical protein
MAIRLKIDNKLLKTKIANLAGVKHAVMPEVFKYFHDITPIRTGNARNNTHLSGDEIDANYDYAGKLDEGYSNQAPAGMTEPTKEYAKKITKEWIKRNGAK